MNTNLTGKSRSVKAIAKKDKASGKIKSTPVVIAPSEQPVIERREPLPENKLSLKNSDPACECPIFYNEVTEKQKEYVIKLIEDRIKREGLELESVFSGFASVFKYDKHKAKLTGIYLESLLTLIYKHSLLDNICRGHWEKERIIEALATISSYLTGLSDDFDRPFFDLCKAKYSYKFEFRDLEEIQREHIERQVVDDGIFAFDLAFEIPFHNLSEEAKVERLKIYLQQHSAWTDEDFILPAHVKKYLPQVQAILNANQ